MVTVNLLYHTGLSQSTKLQWKLIMNEQSKTPFRPRQHLDYPELTMYQMVARIAGRYPDYPAYEFYRKQTSYHSFLNQIDQAARAFYASGIRPGDAVTICMPNTPQALVCFYAVNRISGIANMVHPQSAQNEITFYLNFSHSKMILTMDLFYEKVAKALAGVDHPVTILTARMQEELPLPLALAFTLKTGMPFLKYPGKSLPSDNGPSLSGRDSSHLRLQRIAAHDISKY